MNEQKSGWKTSEFWMTLVVQIIAVLVNTGLVNASDGSFLGGTSSKIMTGVVAAAALWKYIHSRTEIKLGPEIQSVAHLPLPGFEKPLVYGENTSPPADPKASHRYTEPPVQK